jgi:hypothetical protein
MLRQYADQQPGLFKSVLKTTFTYFTALVAVAATAPFSGTVVLIVLVLHEFATSRGAYQGHTHNGSDVEPFPINQPPVRKADKAISPPDQIA